MTKEVKSALILAFILLVGTGLFFWQAGFFNQSTPICQCECYPEDCGYVVWNCELCLKACGLEK